MKIALKMSLIGLSAAFAFAAAAQDTGGTVAEQFPVGTEPEVQVGQTFLVENNGNWDLMCVKVAEGPQPCEIAQLVLDEQSKPIADIRLFPLPPGGQAIAGGTFVIPLGVVLPNGLNFAVDDAESRQYPFAFCNNIGCVARVGFTPLELEALRSGNEGKMTFRMINDPSKVVTLPLSLKGFSKSFAALQKRILSQQEQ